MQRRLSCPDLGARDFHYFLSTLDPNIRLSELIIKGWIGVVRDDERCVADQITLVSGQAPAQLQLGCSVLAW